MMNYQEECVKLESTQWYEPNRRLLHVAMGLCTETAELGVNTDPQNFLEELGDVLWYSAVGCDVLGITMYEAVEMAPNVEDIDPMFELIKVSTDILDMLKKQIFYGRAYDPKVVGRKIGEIIQLVAILADDENHHLEEIEALNLAKLHRRYASGGFTSQEANNRDVKNEMSVYS